MGTYYEILGVSEVATQDEIKKAFKKMVRRWHPDMNPGNEDAIKMTQLINEAYSVLSDISKKKQYDSKLANSRKQNSSKQSKSSNRTSDFYKESTKKNTNSNRTDNSSKKLAQDVIDEFKEMNKILSNLYLNLLIDFKKSNKKKIDTILKALEYIDNICEDNFSLIGLSCEKISKCDLVGCKISLFDLKKILLQYDICLNFKCAFISLKGKYGTDNNDIFNSNYDTFKKNNINIEKKIIKNKFY